ncbi:hypothetical protein GGI00_001826 [Coemansia sp. RSA 2681]|nr:hypothetical protein GGI00_001826 [Coemansia sp. RSA 2681]
MDRQFTKSEFFKTFQCNVEQIETEFRQALEEAQAPQTLIADFNTRNPYMFIVSSSAVSALPQSIDVQGPVLTYKFRMQRGDPDYTCSLEAYSVECRDNLNADE